jgi:hypothetical protein
MVCVVAPMGTQHVRLPPRPTDVDNFGSSLDATNLDDDDTADGLNGDVKNTSHVHEDDGSRNNYLAYGTAQPNTRDKDVGDGKEFARLHGDSLQQKETNMHKIKVGTADPHYQFAWLQVPPRSVIPARRSAPPENSRKFHHRHVIGGNRLSWPDTNIIACSNSCL